MEFLRSVLGWVGKVSTESNAVTKPDNFVINTVTIIYAEVKVISPMFMVEIIVHCVTDAVASKRNFLWNCL